MASNGHPEASYIIQYKNPYATYHHTTSRTRWFGVKHECLLPLAVTSLLTLRWILAQPVQACASMWHARGDYVVESARAKSVFVVAPSVGPSMLGHSATGGPCWHDTDADAAAGSSRGVGSSERLRLVAVPSYSLVCFPQSHLHPATFHHRLCSSNQSLLQRPVGET